jgi:two-component system response regulator YesN
MGLRILVVEDEIKPREGLVRLIGKLGSEYEVVGQARNGSEGLEMAAALAPALILTDVKMPSMDGLEMIAALRQSGCAARFILISGYADFEYARRGIALGVKEYLLKPITKPMLEEALGKVRDELERDSGKAERLLPPVMHEDIVSRLPRGEPEYPQRIEASALEAVRGNDADGLEAAVEDFYLYCVSGKYSPDGISEIAHRFFFSVTNLMKELDYSRFRAIIDRNVLDRVLHYRGVDELHAVFNDFLASIVQVSSAPSEPYSHPVRLAVNYIKSGYRGKLSLEDAAEMAGLSPEYLSKLFLKETGRNFSTYVAEYRIEKSKPLLAAGELKAYEVAASVGISDPQYFCRVFKKCTGLSPGEYARLHAI